MKEKRHAAILELVGARRVHSQEELRRLLTERGFSVTQATLSRDLRELRIAKVPGAGGESYYAPAPESADEPPALEALLSQLMLGVDGVGHQVVLRTVKGAANAVAEAIDLEAMPEILGTIAGDDTILIVIRDESAREALIRRLEELGSQ